MASSLSPIEEKLLAACCPAETAAESVVDINSNREYFSLACLLRTTQMDGKAVIISQVTYDFPPTMSVRSREALHYAESINGLLQHSQVFVMQNIDGDRRYALRMDTLLKNPENKDGIALFLDHITADIDVIVQYFNHRTAHQIARTQQSAFRQSALR